MISHRSAGVVTNQQALVAKAKPCNMCFGTYQSCTGQSSSSCGKSPVIPCQTAVMKLGCCVQAQKHLSTSVVQPPSEGTKLVSASFQQGHLTVMWSDGLLQSYNTAGPMLNVQTSRRLHAFDLGLDQTVLDNQDQQYQQQPAQQHTGNKKRKSTAAAATEKEPAPDNDMPPTTPVPLLVPLGGHSVAAIREPSDLPSNGHHSSDLEITVADTQYGCIQSVASVKLPGSGAVDRHGKDQQEALQLSSGMGNLVLLMHGAVWYISIQVSHSRECVRS